MSHRTIAAFATVGLVLGGNVACGASPRGSLPSLDGIREMVSRHFELLPYYRPGDVISQSEVEPLFVQLARMGWIVRDRRSILHRVPSDHDFLVRQLRTPDGREFMGQVAELPNVYDRLDGLSWLPHGREAVQELIRRPDAAEAVQSLVNSADEKKAAAAVFHGVKLGANFHKPTGHIYTVKMLLAQLEKSYQETRKRAAAAEQ